MAEFNASKLPRQATSQSRFLVMACVPTKKEKGVFPARIGSHDFNELANPSDLVRFNG